MSTRLAEPSGTGSIRSGVEPTIDMPINGSITCEQPSHSRFRRWSTMLVVIVIGGAGAAYYFHHQTAARGKSQASQAAGDAGQQGNGKASLGFLSPARYVGRQAETGLAAL